MGSEIVHLFAGYGIWCILHVNFVVWTSLVIFGEQTNNDFCGRGFNKCKEGIYCVVCSLPYTMPLFIFRIYTLLRKPYNDGKSLISVIQLIIS